MTGRWRDGSGEAMLAVVLGGILTKSEELSSVIQAA